MGFYSEIYKGGEEARETLAQLSMPRPTPPSLTQRIAKVLIDHDYPISMSSIHGVAALIFGRSVSNRGESARDPSRTSMLHNGGRRTLASREDSPPRGLTRLPLLPAITPSTNLMPTAEQLMLQDLHAKYAAVQVGPAFTRLYGTTAVDHMFAHFHERLNKHFNFMNYKAGTNGHFNAEDSRQLIALIEEIQEAQEVLTTRRNRVRRRGRLPSSYRTMPRISGSLWRESHSRRHASDRRCQVRTGVLTV